MRGGDGWRLAAVRIALAEETPLERPRQGLRARQPSGPGRLKPESPPLIVVILAARVAEGIGLGREAVGSREVSPRRAG
jgi:hypothetical protein